jgi:lipopolysaccharide/colanic/teichoic acid biosynthesis glycosyltransferase
MQYLLQLGIIDDFFEDVHDQALISKKVQFLIKYKQSSKSPRLLEVDKVKSYQESDTRMMFVKRLFDISISLILLILLIPLFIFVGLAIKFESRGPIFYVSKRVGRHYRVFPMIKFRSMRDGADQVLDDISHLNMYGNENELGAFVKIKNDPRVSEVGKFLRKTSIDEFPQLLNVLMGHMSIVGNRPLPLYEAEKLLVNEYVSRFDAPAGITGLWQVIKKEKPDMNEQDRIHLDIRYSKECSFLNDLWIILKTPGALLQNQNY